MATGRRPHPSGAPPPAMCVSPGGGCADLGATLTRLAYAIAQQERRARGTPCRSIAWKRSPIPLATTCPIARGMRAPAAVPRLLVTPAATGRRDCIRRQGAVFRPRSMACSEGLGASRQSCFVVATSTSPAPGSDPQSARKPWPRRSAWTAGGGLPASVVAGGRRAARTGPWPVARGWAPLGGFRCRRGGVIGALQ